MLDLYYLFTADFINIDLEQYASYLSQEEKETQKRYFFQKDRDQYLLTRVLVRSILSKQLGIQPSELVFEKNEFGKPALSHPNSNLAFNISHSAGLIILAVGQDLGPIGIDVENTTRNIELEIVMPTVFQEHEIVSLLSLASSEQKVRFFELWTLKESYMKAIGKGFHVPPTSFSFDFQEAKLHFQFDSNDSEFRQFYFRKEPIRENYQFAICTTTEIGSIHKYKINSEFKSQSI